MIYLIITFILLNVADILITNHGLNKGSVERNKLMAYFMHHLGTFWWVPKMLMTAGLIAVCVYLQAVLALVVLNVLYTAGIAWNLYQVSKL